MSDSILTGVALIDCSIIALVLGGIISAVAEWRRARSARSGAAVARVAHAHEVAGSTPASASGAMRGSANHSRAGSPPSPACLPVPMPGSSRRAFLLAVMWHRARLRGRREAIMCRHRPEYRN